MPLLPGGKVVEQLLTEIQMPDDEEIVGITDNLVVEQEPIMAAAVSFNENAPETLAQELPMLDKVNCFFLNAPRCQMVVKGKCEVFESRDLPSHLPSTVNAK